MLFGNQNAKARRRSALRSAVKSVELLESRQLLSGTTGLNDAAYHLGGGNSNANDSLFGGSMASLNRVSNYAATNAPDYTFTNSATTFNYQGGSGAITPNFLGSDASGAASTDTKNVNDTIFDAKGFFVAPTAGAYTFQIGDGTGGHTDDIVGIYVGGNGTSGSGTLVAADGWQGATSPFETSSATTAQATFSLPAGNVPVEIIYGNGFGGANLNGVAITDPNSTQVAYLTDAAENIAPQAAPTLNAPTVANQQVSLSWNPVTFGDSYSVYRSDPSHSTPVSVGTGLTTTSFTDTSVTNGVQYTYFVVPVDSAGPGPASNSVTATPVLLAPTGLKAVRTDANAVAISFTAPQGATSYDVRRGTALNGDGTLGGTVTDVTPGGVSTTSATDSAAPRNTTFYYAVTASNASGNSAPTPAVTVAAAAAQPTALASEGTVEVDLRAANLAAGPATAWANSGSAGGSFTAVGATAPTVAAVTDANNVTYTAVALNGKDQAFTSNFNAPVDLTGNNARSIEVWVLNPTIDSNEETMVAWARRGGPDGTNESFSYGSQYGVGEWGGEYDMTWQEASPAATAPVANVWHNLTFTYDGNGSENVYVDGQLDLSGASNGLQNIGQLATAVGFPIDIGAQNANPGLASFGSLDIAAVRISSGALSASDVAQNYAAGVESQSTPANAPASAPTLATPAANDKVVNLNWTYVGDAGAGFSYSVFRSDPGHTTPVAVATGLTTLSYSDTSVTDGTAYTYYVQAVNAAGAGPASNSVMVTPQLSAPVAPTNVVATVGTVSGVNTANPTASVTLTWTASQFATDYQVLRSDTPGGPYTPLATGITGTTYTDATAPLGKVSYYVVEAHNAGGYGPNSSEAAADAADGALFNYYADEYWRTGTDNNGPNLGAGITAGTGPGAAIPSDVQGFLPTVDYTAGEGNPAALPPYGTQAAPYSDVITGQVHTGSTSGSYTFDVNTDDGGFLYVEGQLVSSYGGFHGNAGAAFDTPISLDANSNYSFEFFHNQGGGGHAFTLAWEQPDDTQFTTIPQQNLRVLDSAPAAATGLALDTNAPITSHGATIDFVDNADNEIRYVLQRSTDPNFATNVTNVTSAGVHDNTQNLNAGNQPIVTITDNSGFPGMTYYYRVEAQNFYGVSDSTPLQVKTAAATPTPNTSTEHLYNSDWWGSTTLSDNGYATPKLSADVVASYAQSINEAGNPPATPMNAGNNAGTTGLDFSTIFTGQIKTDAAGTYIFETSSDDSSFLVVDGQLVASFPGVHGDNTPGGAPGTLDGPANLEVPITLAANTTYNFQYYQRQGNNGWGLHMKWTEPGGAEEVVPVATATSGGIASPIESAPADPTLVAGATASNGQSFSGVTANSATVNFVDNSVSELFYVLQRSTDPNFAAASTVNIEEPYVNNPGGAAANASFTDTGLTSGTTYFYRVQAFNYDGQSAILNLGSVTPGNAASVTLSGVAINDGSTAAGTANQTQRSEVRDLILKFSGPVQLTAGDFVLSQLNTGGSGKNDGSAPTPLSGVIASATSPDGGATWVLTFNKSVGTNTDATGSLTDGIYTVTVNSPSVTGTNLTTTFHRLFGDINGDKQVSNTDYFQFRKAFNTSSTDAAYNADFDYNGDGSIGNVDYFQFRKRFLMSFTY